jgi:hypothetical protein
MVPLTLKEKGEKMGKRIKCSCPKTKANRYYFRQKEPAAPAACNGAAVGSKIRARVKGDAASMGITAAMLAIQAQQQLVKNYF